MPGGLTSRTSSDTAAGAERAFVLRVSAQKKRMGTRQVAEARCRLARAIEVTHHASDHMSLRAHVYPRARPAQLHSYPVCTRPDLDHGTGNRRDRPSLCLLHPRGTQHLSLRSPPTMSAHGRISAGRRTLKRAAGRSGCFDRYTSIPRPYVSRGWPQTLANWASLIGRSRTRAASKANATLILGRVLAGLRCGLAS
jgi:hypothetical protein